jgi:hypothetical protein
VASRGHEALIRSLASYSLQMQGVKITFGLFQLPPNLARIDTWYPRDMGTDKFAWKGLRLLCWEESELLRATCPTGVVAIMVFFATNDATP